MDGLVLLHIIYILTGEDHTLCCNWLTVILTPGAYLSTSTTTHNLVSFYDVTNTRYDSYVYNNLRFFSYF